MLQQFLIHIDQNKICTPADKILLAVSGGIDSMVMFQLFKAAGYEIGVVHCNFQLRGAESQGDEAFVTEVCKTLEVPIHVQYFETQDFAEQHGISTQMAARELRYTYFNELIKEFEYKYLATAHHINDSLETVLLNLVRGTGIEGLTGIAVKKDNIIRPLLFGSREMINEYAKQNHIKWREDSSNSSDKYHRNLIRNQVVPLLKKLNPNLEESFQHTTERIQGASLLVKESIKQFREEAIRESDNIIYIDKIKLHALPSSDVILWELIKDKGFNFKQCKEVLAGDHQSGKIFYSDTYQLTVDRIDLIISSSIEKSMNVISIEASDVYIYRGTQQLNCETIIKADFVLQKDSSLAQLDFDLLHFPISWRSWCAGDRFMPLGMDHHKKISDFLIDIKLPLPDKNKITVLESNDEVVWVVGYRISEKFKVTDNTQYVKIFQLKSEIN